MTAQGSIVNHAFTSDAKVPIPDTTVIITQLQPDGIYELVSVQITDKSGKTEPVLITTPEKSESLTPGGDNPFATVNIEADNPMYQRIIVENVQVFANTQTLQELQLIPLDENPDDFNETELFETPAQAL